MRGIEFRNAPRAEPPAGDVSRQIEKVRRTGEEVAARKVRAILRPLFASVTIADFNQEQAEDDDRLADAPHPESDTVKKAMYGRNRPAV